MKKLSLMLVLLLAFTLTGFTANNRMISMNPPNPSLKAGDLPQPMTMELYYDDGTWENAWCWYEAGSYWGTWFTSTLGYPIRIDKFKWAIWDGWPDYDREQIGLEIWDCNTYTILWETYVTSAAAGWNEAVISPTFEVLNDWIGSIKQTTPYPDCEGMCVDEDGPYAGRDGMWYYGYAYWMGICYAGGYGFGNWLIRQDLSCQTVRCKLILYQVKIPRGSTFDFCLSFWSGLPSKVTVTGDLIFKKGGVEKKRIPVTGQVQPGVTVHKVYGLKVPANAAEGADYSVEFQGTASGYTVKCGPEGFEIIEAAAAFVDGPCPCEP